MALINVAEGRVEDLFSLRPRLEEIYDKISENDTNPFTAESTKATLDEIWEQHKARSIVLKPLREAGRIREIIQGRGSIPVRLDRNHIVGSARADGIAFSSYFFLPGFVGYTESTAHYGIQIRHSRKKNSKSTYHLSDITAWTETNEFS